MIRVETTTKLLLRVCLALLALSQAPFAKAQRPAALDRKAIISNAQQSYYNGRSRGLVEFTATILPNWPAMLKDEKPTAEGLKFLDGLHFTMTLDANDQVKVAHTANVTITDEHQLDGLKKIFGGMERMMTGFFATWSQMTLHSPFPEVASDYVVVLTEGNYQIRFRDGADDVVMTTDRDYAITEMKLSSPGYKGSMYPHFVKAQGQFLLAGYEADFVPVSGGPGRVRLKIRPNYREVDGLQLPSQLTADISLDDEKVNLELSFIDDKVKKQ